MSSSKLENNLQPEMTFVKKGWGSELWITNTEKYCGKLLTFNKEKKCSLHFHKLKDEVFFIQSGKIEVEWIDEIATVEDLDSGKKILNKIILNKGDNFYIPPGRVHRMTAIEDTELFEFSTQHFEEDSYRIVKGD